MNPIDIAAAAFAALPHINRVWVDAKGHFHLHPENGGVLVERNVSKVETPAIENVIVEPHTKRNKRNKGR